MKKWLKKGLAGVLTAAMVVGLMPSVGSVPDQVLAATTPLTVDFNMTSLAPADGKWNNNYKVYFGKYGSNPTAFRVLSVTDGRMLIDCDTVLYQRSFNEHIQDDNVPDPGQKSGKVSEYGGSDLQLGLMGQEYYGKSGVFSEGEKNAIADTNLAAADNYKISSFQYKEYKLDNQKVFLLSANEANELYATGDYGRPKVNGGTGVNWNWWLRSECNSPNNYQAGCVLTGGSLSYYGVDATADKYSCVFGVSPALNLDLSKVCFTTDSTFAKTGTFPGTKISATSTKEKVRHLTLSGGEGFAASRTESGNVASGGTVTVAVSSIGTPTSGVSYDRISAILADSSNTIQYYGKVKDGASTGNVNITLPAGLTSDATYKLYVFAEDVNSSSASHVVDYASNMVPFELTIGGAAPVKENIQSITQPSAMTVKNGTLYANMGLPSTVTITTDKGSKQAAVTWNTTTPASGSYNPSVLTQQKVTLNGTVTLPDGVTNENNKSLQTQIVITISAADKVSKPTATPSSGTYTKDLSVALQSSTSGADIYYTLNGTTPDTTSTRFTTGSPIKITGTAGTKKTVTVKAVAVKAGMQNSDVAEFTYIINIPHTHNWEAAWTSDDTYHWHKCTAAGCDGTLGSKAKHTETDWIMDTKPTETEDGTRHTECTECKKRLKTETIPKSEQVKEYTVTVTNGTLDNENGKTSGTYHTSEEVSVRADAPENGKQFKEWSGTEGLAFSSNTNKNEMTIIFLMPEKDVTLTAVYEDAPVEHTHVWDTEWTCDDTDHWHKCTAAGCDGTVKDKAVHTPGSWIIDKKPTANEDGIQHTECTVCKYRIETQTIPKEETLVEYPVTVEGGTLEDGTRNGTSYVGEIITVTADAPESGKRFKEWSGADGLTFLNNTNKNDRTAVFAMPDKSVTLTAVYEDVSVEHSHNWDEKWTYDDTEHWHKCTAAGCDGTVNDKASHIAGSWIIDKNPTADEDGIKHNECTVCKKIMETVTISKTEQLKPYQVTVEGGTLQDGKVNGTYYAGNAITVTAATPESGKRFKEWQGTDGLTFLNNTDKNDMTAVFVMPEKDVTLTAGYEEIPVGHIHEWDTKWTCDKSYHWYKCIAAGCNGEVKEKAAHTPGSWIIVQKPTADADGIKHRVCTVCQKTIETETIPKEEPLEEYTVTVKNGTLTDGSESGTYCEGQEVTVTAATPESGKRFKEWQGTDGLTFLNNTNENDMMAAFLMPKKDVTLTAVYESIGTAHEHTWNTAWSSDEESHWHGCTASGCDGTVNDKAAHVAGDWIIDKEATKDTEGMRHKECSVCQKKLATETIPKKEETPEPPVITTPVKGEEKIDTKTNTKVEVTNPGRIENGKIVDAEAAYTKPVKSGKTVTIPDTVTDSTGVTYKVTSIAANAFKKNKTITTVKIGNYVKTIPSNAFSGCTKLKKVTIGSSVTKIGTGAFSGCKKLTGVTIGKNVTQIGNKAFYNCSVLTKVTIPANVTQIGKQAFYNCRKLKTITIKSTKLKSVGSKAISGIHKKAVIKVPKKKLSKYKKLFKSSTGFKKTMKIKK